MNKGYTVKDCPIKLEVCFPSCKYWFRGECHHNELMRNNKGTWCWVLPSRFCQEGECLNCQIYMEAVNDNRE